MKCLLLASLAASTLACASTLDGYVTIGDPGNGASGAMPVGSGSVAYEYQISQYEVSYSDYKAFDNYLDPALTGSAFAKNAWGDSGPVCNVSVYEAMSYCNWLTTESGGTAAYSFAEDGSVTIDRDAAISSTSAGSYVYVLPTYDEWVKAAFYNEATAGWSLYTTGTYAAHASGTVGIGLSEAWGVEEGVADINGTSNMSGNVGEWLEDESGTYAGALYNAQTESSLFLGPQTYNPDGSPTVGFRVAAVEGVEAVPEPATASLCLVAGLIGFLVRRFQAA